MNERFEKLLKKYPHEHRTFSQRPHWSRREFFELAGAGVVASFMPSRAYADGVSQAFSALLGGLQSMYEHQLYLKTLFELLDFQPQVRAPESPVPMRHPIEEGILHVLDPGRVHR